MYELISIHQIYFSDSHRFNSIRKTKKNCLNPAFLQEGKDTNPNPSTQILFPKNEKKIYPHFQTILTSKSGCKDK